MKHTPLLTLILLAMHQSHAEDNIPRLNPFIFHADTSNKDEIIVEKEKLEHAKNLGDALKHVSGVQSTSFGPHSGAPMIRSLEGSRVGILENGQSIYGMNAISGNINIPFDPLFTKHVTVHKGTQSVRYGGHAIGGSVDIDTGIISKEMEDKSHHIDIAVHKGFNDFNAHGIRVNLNNQKNFSTNIQFSNQRISSYDIPGNSKASICESAVFPSTGVINSALSSACQKDSRIKQIFNQGHYKYLNKYVLDHIAQNPDNFYDYYDGLESAKYTNDKVSNYFVGSSNKSFINEVNPHYVPGTAKHVEQKINHDVTPNYNKTLGNSYATNENIALGSTYFLPNGYIGVSADYKTSEYGVPGFSMENKSFQDSYADGLPVGVRIKQNRFAVESLFKAPAKFIESVAFKASRLSNTSGEYLGAKNVNAYTFDSDHTELVVRHQPFDRLSGELGTSINMRSVNGSGSKRYLPNVKTDTYAFFVQEKIDFDRFSYDAGYRTEKVNHEIQDQSFNLARNASNGKLENKSFKLNHFYFGSDFKATDYLNFRLQYSESERAPEINELYGSNAHYSIMAQEEGNQKLNKEKMQSLELKTHLHWNKTLATLSLYQMDFEDYLYTSNSGASVENRLPLKYWKQTDTQVKGFEADIKHTFKLNQWGDFTIGGFADLVKNKATDPNHLRLANDGIYLPNMPTNRYGASIQWDRADWSAELSNIYYAQPRYLGKNVFTELPLPSYHLLDLDIRKKIRFKNSDFEFFIHGSNLLNDEARPQNSPLKYIAPLPGRAMQLGFRMKI